MNTQPLIQAFERDLINHKRLARLSWLWAFVSLGIIGTMVLITGIRTDIANNTMSTQFIAGLTGIVILHFGLYANLFRVTQGFRNVVLATTALLAIMTYWSPLVSIFYGLQWGGLGQLNFWSADFRCFQVGFQVSCAVMLVHILIQLKMRLIPTAMSYFLTGTLAATSGLLTQCLHCGSTRILHLSAAHLGQAATVLILCIIAQSLIFSYQRTQLKRLCK